VLFVCLHGAAKSVIAAEYLRQLAAERGLDVEVAAAGIEPDAEIPPNVVSSLLVDGIDVSGRQPVGARGEMVEGADLIVSFGCDLGGIAPSETRVSYWTDVPMVSDGYDAARDEIVRRVTSLLDEILSESGPKT
jgi:protein-tyrosine-phosphatase